MTPETAAQIRDAYNRQVIPLLHPRNTPESFYWIERWGNGPKPLTSIPTPMHTPTTSVEGTQANQT